MASGRIRISVAVLGGVAGALNGGALMAMITAALLSHSLAAIGGLAGLGAGFGGGVWLVLRQNSRWAGSAVVGLWAMAILITLCLGFVALSRGR